MTTTTPEFQILIYVTLLFDIKNSKTLCFYTI